MYSKKSLWKSEQNFFSAKEYFEALVNDINRAKKTVYLECYIFEIDEVGRKVVGSLINAKERGLKVHVIVDGIGSMNTMASLLSSFEKTKGALKIYHPLPWNFRGYQYSVNKGTALEKLLHFTNRINKRDHRKLCIIDDEVAWTGSFNICKQHLKIEDGGEGWKDHGLRVTGESVQHLSIEFLQVWQQKVLQKLRKPLPFILSTLNPHLRKDHVSRLVQSIDTAKQRVWIANAYFAPPRAVITALTRARDRGVDVNILVGGKSDVIFFPGLTRSFYADLLNKNISIYEWREGILHSKIVLIDDYFLTGSTNLNTRSQVHDLELDILACLEPTVMVMEKQFKEDFARSKKIEFKYIHENTFYIFLMSIIPRLLRYWL